MNDANDASLQSELLVSILVAVFGVALGGPLGLLIAGLATAFGVIVHVLASIGAY